MTFAEFGQHAAAVVPALFASGGIGFAVKTVLDHLRAKRKASDDVAMTLVQQLNDRVRTLEAARDGDRALYDANMAIMRHRMNNLKQSFDGLLMLIEADPRRAGEFVAKIKEMRVKQEAEELAEKAAVQAARLAATGLASGMPGVGTGEAAAA